MGKGQPDDIIILQIWITAKLGNTKLEKLILYVFAKKNLIFGFKGDFFLLLFM